MSTIDHPLSVNVTPPPPPPPPLLPHHHQQLQSLLDQSALRQPQSRCGCGRRRGTRGCLPFTAQGCKLSRAALKLLFQFLRLALGFVSILIVSPFVSFNLLRIFLSHSSDSTCFCTLLLSWLDFNLSSLSTSIEQRPLNQTWNSLKTYS